MSLFLQIFVIVCFIVVIIALFREKSDFLTYSIASMFAAVVATFLIIPDMISIDGIILYIEWEVIFFLIAIFTIVEILEDHKIFEEIALRITNKFHTNTRKFFWIMCIISTLSAAFIEDVSVAIIFIPLIIKTCQKMHINPTPFLLGITICINLASTLTPFGSSENILIATKFKLSSVWFVMSLGLYFVITTLITLFLLDYFVLKKSLKEIWLPHCELKDEPLDEAHIINHELIISEEHIDDWVFKKNLIALFVFIILLLIIPNILFVGIFSALMFVIINPREDSEGKKRRSISYYLAKVDYKLVFFFMCLFILVFCMELNGTLLIIENLVESTAHKDLFLMCLIILIVTSIFSAFLDNIPVTVIFIPIMSVLIYDVGFAMTPLMIAFILGINLGGNFLPQGAACDMVTLEFAKKNHIHQMNYKRLLKIGGLFALLHIIIGIAYLWFIIYFFF
ncbi:MAG: SLC13 family permease [Promethearchaeota archaeon]